MQNERLIIATSEADFEIARQLFQEYAGFKEIPSYYFNSVKVRATFNWIWYSMRFVV